MSNWFSNNKAFSDLIERMGIDTHDLPRIGPFSNSANADLARVVYKFTYWLLTDSDGMRQYATPELLETIDAVAALYARLLAGETVSPDEWRSVNNQTQAAIKTVPEELDAACEVAVGVEAAGEPEGICAWIAAFSAAEAAARAVDDGLEETQTLVSETFLRARNRISVKFLELVKAEAEAAA